MQRPCVRCPRSSARRWQRAIAGLLVLAATACSTKPADTHNAAHQSAVVLSQNAARALHQGNNEQALAMYARALALADSVEDFDLAGATLLNLAMVHASLGQPAAAQMRVDRLLAAPQLYAPQLRAQAMARKGLLALDAPDLDGALRWADAAIAACAAPCALTPAMTVLRAHVAHERRDFEASARLAEQASVSAAALAQEPERANAERLAGRAHSAAGHHEIAAQRLAQALAIDQRLGNPDRIALDLIAAGDNEGRRAQREMQRQFYERAVNVYLALGNSAAADAVRRRSQAIPAGEREP